MAQQVLHPALKDKEGQKEGGDENIFLSFESICGREQIKYVYEVSNKYFSNFNGIHTILCFSNEWG